MSMIATVWRAAWQANTAEADANGGSRENPLLGALTGGQLLLMWQDDASVSRGLPDQEVDTENPSRNEQVSGLSPNQEIHSISSPIEGGFNLADRTIDGLANLFAQSYGNPDLAGASPLAAHVGSSGTLLGQRFGSAGSLVATEYPAAGTTIALAPAFLLPDDGRFAFAGLGVAGDANVHVRNSRTAPIFNTDDSSISAAGITLSGGDGAQTLNGGTGDDVIYGHSAADLNQAASAIDSAMIANVGAAPVFLTGAPGDDGFVYVVRKNTGEILRVDASTGAQSTFLDIPQEQFSNDSERGVLGLAFHPDYDTDGRFFVFLTTPAGDLQVREYARAAGNPPVADPMPVSTVVTIPHPGFANHNGGYIGFGPDGYLYIATGDGGGNDPNNNGQNIDTLLGKILRLDISADAFPGDPGRNYAIPGSNPFAGATAGADEIWAYGLRNPWRISFDSVTGDLFIGDVGQSAREEVNFQPVGGPGGANYGWDLREGTLPGPSWPPSEPVTLTDPVFDYGRGLGGSITGGYVYHGPAPGLQNAYIFGDFVSGRLFSLRVVNGAAQDFVERTPQVAGTNLGNIASFGVDNAGNLYVVAFDGRIIRLNPAISAGDGSDTIYGGGGSDEIWGGAGNDRINGGTGADRMDGGFGNDFFYVDNRRDTVSDIAGRGSDRVLTTVDYRLAAAAAIETLTTTNQTQTTAIDLTGNKFAQTLVGNAGANQLDGKGGADIMNGMGGDDLYYVDHIGDVAIAAVGAGNDRVLTSAHHALGGSAEVEMLTTVNVLHTTNLALTGNNFGQTIIGNSGHNTLAGKDGADLLNGGNGNDFFVFDTAPSAANIDRVIGYAAANDSIRLDDTVFTQIFDNGAGFLASTQFTRNASGQASDANDRIVYETDTGDLFYDADGTGGLARIQFASLSANLGMTHSEFLVI